jgi:hypothetical protein
MKRRSWLVPPALALAGYFSADTVLPASPDEGAAKTSGGTRAARPKVTIEQALEASSEEWYANAPDRGELEAKATVDELKRRIRELTKAIAELNPDDDSYANYEFLHFQCHDVVGELIKRQKAEGYGWIEENVPELRLVAMDAWRMAEPGAAWQAIISSKRVPPCDIATVTMMLREKAKAKDGGLKQACLEVPWDLFRNYDFNEFHFRAEYRDTGNALSVGFSDDRSYWLESGAALALAEQGMELEGFFRDWASTDPVAALRAWVDWPDAGTYSHEIVDILYRSQPEATQEISAAIESLSAAQRQRAVAGVEVFMQGKPGRVEPIKTFLPLLGIPAAETE